MSSKKIRVDQYGTDTLLQILSINKSPVVIKKKKQFQYLDNYLQFLNVKTIVTELDYIDKHFLDDYAGYYVRCFKEYGKKCMRLHFFNIDFDEATFINFISGDTNELSNENLQSHYQGFSVIKPLPRTMIGRTCLATYPPDQFRRHYPVTQKYDVNLFGINLYIYSLAFQEQDAVVSACATSALWSTLQGTGTMFQHNLPSPLEITTTATKNIKYTPTETRLIPNSGLTIDQMAQTIKNFQLDPLIISASDESILKGHVYAYINSGIPLLLCIHIFDTLQNGKLQTNSAHAINLGGYSIGYSDAIPWGEYNFLLEASKIDELYAHDDNVGPFSKIDINKKNIDPDNPQTYYPVLDTDTIAENQVVIPSVLIVPLYHKIRIPYKYIYEVILSFDALLKTFKQANFVNLSENLVWDISLTTVNKYKTDLFNSAKVDSETKKTILTKRLPRFLWKTVAYVENEIIFEFLFDATDIEQSDAAVNGYVYNNDLLNQIKQISDQEEIEDKLINNPVWQIIKWFRDQNKK